MMTCRLVTFNLRMDNRADGINYFFNRAPYIFDKIQAEKPDIIGFQEAREPIYKWLKAAFSEYEFVGIGRERDFSDEANPIAFRKDRFELFSFDQFWLSETPKLPGSRYREQSPCPRICTAVKLKEKESTNIVHFYNTHLDHVGEKARLLGIGQVLQRIEADYQSAPYPVVLTGDMNAYPSEESMKEVLRLRTPALSDLTEAIKKSFHGFQGGSPYEEGEKIDYIFASPAVHPLSLSVWEDCQEGIYLSDHYPLAVSVAID